MADPAMLQTAIEKAKKLGVPARIGQVFTADMFYNANAQAGQRYKDFGILAVEMETAGIYWEAMASRKRALSLLSISDHIFTGEGLSAQDRQDSFTEMMEVALDTAWEAAE
jgi:purine-nucleoside phosphorylase